MKTPGWLGTAMGHGDLQSYKLKVICRRWTQLLTSTPSRPVPPHLRPCLTKGLLLVLAEGSLETASV